MNVHGVELFPERASTQAAQVDALYFFLVVLSLALTLGIAVMIAFFALRYRQRPSHQRSRTVPTYFWVEIFWTAIPLLVAMGIFVWGASLYLHAAEPPAEAMAIHVVGKQWMWKVQHPEGRREINELHVPLGQPVRLVMTSQDVIHSFFVPAFRMKQDVLPGRYTSQWFTPSRVGEYHLFCSQYCGTSHAQMVGRVVVLRPADYQAWLAGEPREPSAAERGKKLFDAFGCATCHGQQAPTLAGLAGQTVLLENRQQVTADENYLRESILDPGAKIVAGYQPIMPSFRGQLSEEQLFDLIAYIRLLGTPTRRSPPP